MATGHHTSGHCPTVRHPATQPTRASVFFADTGTFSMIEIRSSALPFRMCSAQAELSQCRMEFWRHTAASEDDITHVDMSLAGSRTRVSFIFFRRAIITGRNARRVARFRGERLRLHNHDQQSNFGGERTRLRARASCVKVRKLTLQ
jgi:hypothetical protein